MDQNRQDLIRVPAVVAKVCTRCGHLKPPSHFGRLAIAKDGLNYMCKHCAVERTQAWIRDNRDRCVALLPAYRRHGLSDVDFEELLAAQGGVCAICGQPQQAGQRLAVDHDHACCPGGWSCGRCIRGLLCHRCNRMIGLLGDSAAVARSLAAYVAPRRELGSGQ